METIGDGNIFKDRGILESHCRLGCQQPCNLFLTFPPSVLSKSLILPAVHDSSARF